MNDSAKTVAFSGLQQWAQRLIFASTITLCIGISSCSRLNSSSHSLEYFCGVSQADVPTEHVYLALFNEDGKFQPVSRDALSFFPKLLPQQAAAVDVINGCVVLPREQVPAMDAIVHGNGKIASLVVEEAAVFQALDLKQDIDPVDLHWVGCEAEPQAMRSPMGIRLAGGASGYLHAELRDGQSKKPAERRLLRQGLNLTGVQIFEGRLADGIYTLGGYFETPSGRPVDLGQRQFRVRIDSTAPTFLMEGLRPLMRPGERLEARLDFGDMAEARLWMHPVDDSGMAKMVFDLLKKPAIAAPSEGRWRLSTILRDRAGNETRWQSGVTVDATDPVLRPQQEFVHAGEKVLVAGLLKHELSEAATVEACWVRSSVAQCPQSEYKPYTPEALQDLESGDYTLLLRVTDQAGNTAVQSHKLVVPEGGYLAWCLREKHTADFIEVLTNNQARDCFAADQYFSERDFVQIFQPVLSEAAHPEIELDMLAGYSKLDSINFRRKSDTEKHSCYKGAGGLSCQRKVKTVSMI